MIRQYSFEFPLDLCEDTPVTIVLTEGIPIVFTPFPINILIQAVIKKVAIIIPVYFPECVDWGGIFTDARTLIKIIFVKTGSCSVGIIEFSIP